jgi:hypothetical protein
MSRSWVSKDELSRQSDFYRQQIDELRAVIVELAAALVRLDKNGYQERLLAQALPKARVTREQVDRFNVDRAENIPRKWPRP